MVKRGAAPPVDARSGWATTHEVLITPDGVWDATLNQTDVGNNANKYGYCELARTYMCLTQRGFL